MPNCHRSVPAHTHTHAHNNAMTAVRCQIVFNTHTEPTQWTPHHTPSTTYKWIWTLPSVKQLLLALASNSALMRRAPPWHCVCVRRSIAPPTPHCTAWQCAACVHACWHVCEFGTRAQWASYKSNLMALYALARLVRITLLICKMSHRIVSHAKRVLPFWAVRRG